MRTRDELLADLVAYGGAWLARTRLGGSAREEFRRAWLEASALSKASPPPLPSPHEGEGEGGGRSDDAPALEFAPPDAAAAGECPLEGADAAAAETPPKSRRYWMDERDED